MRRLSFATSFEVLLCLDGTLPERSIFQQCTSLPLIAADGAAVKLLRSYGIFPTTIVGDLDALLLAPEREAFRAIPQVQIAEQETTDFEKILRFAQQQGWRRLLVVGFQGGEPDHTLINWSVAARYVQTFELCFYDAGRYAIPLTASTIVELEPGETVSLLPQETAVVTTEGLVWELKRAELRWGQRESARNLVRQAPVSIELHSGVVWLFCQSRFPKAPLVVG